MYLDRAMMALAYAYLDRAMIDYKQMLRNFKNGRSLIEYVR